MAAMMLTLIHVVWCLLINVGIVVEIKYCFSRRRFRVKNSYTIVVNFIRSRCR